MLGRPGLRNTFGHREFLVWEVSLRKLLQESAEGPDPHARQTRPPLTETLGLLSQGLSELGTNSGLEEEAGRQKEMPGKGEGESREWEEHVHRAKCPEMLPREQQTRRLVPRSVRSLALWTIQRQRWGEVAIAKKVGPRLCRCVCGRASLTLYLLLKCVS